MKPCKYVRNKDIREDNDTWAAKNGLNIFSNYLAHLS